MTTNDEQSTGAPRRRRKRGRQATQSNRRPTVDAATEKVESAALSQVMNEFVLCGRCSYFLAGCRIIYGLEVLETAVQSSDQHSLGLPWDMNVRRLLLESYGFDIDATLLWFEGYCRECGRRFAYGDPDREEGADRLYVQLVAH